MTVARTTAGLILAGTLTALAVPAAAQTTGSIKPDQIREHMEVKGSDGVHVGTVDKVQGSTITLTRDDPAAGGVHHTIPLASAASVTGVAVMLNESAADAKRTWAAAPRPGGDKSK